MKTRLKFLILFGLLLSLISSNIFAQNFGKKKIQNVQVQFNEPVVSDIPFSTCGLTGAIDEANLTDPNFAQKEQEALQKMIQSLKKAQTNKTDLSKSTDPMVIPVVFHVIYGCESSIENIEEDRIFTAIQQLNDDLQGNSSSPDNHYAALNGGMNVEFVLAEKDPLGNPTTGIVRTQSPLTYKGIGQEKALRKLIMWPRDKYLNVYVLHSVNPKGNSGVAWYPSQSDGDEYLRDGVAIAHWAVGPNPNGNYKNYKSTLAHEVGHWLGLRHIWGGLNSPELGSNCNIDDFSFLDDEPSLQNIFNDTPNTIGTSEKYVCPNSMSCGNQDMVENIMNYTVFCQNTFTIGQCSYMEYALSLDIADRNNLHSDANLAQTLYEYDNTPRLVFQNTILKENDDNAGNINYELDIKLINANFVNPSTTLSSNYYDIEWASGFNHSNLNVEVVTQSYTTAKLIVSGYTPDHYEDIEFTITFSNYHAPFNKSIQEANRSKTLNIDFIEEVGITYRNIAPNIVWGPEDVLYEAFEPIEGVCMSAYYRENQYRLVTFCGGLEIKTNNGLVTTFTNPNTFIPTYGEYSEDPSIVGLILDTDNIAEGQEFFVGFRAIGCTGNRYGWIRMEKVSINGCEQIIIHDMAYNSVLDQGLWINTFDKPTLTFQDNIIQETAPESGTYGNIRATIKGPFNGSFVNNIDVNDFEIFPITSYVPNNFDKNNVIINKVDYKTVDITINSPDYFSKDFQFMIRFNDSAFTGFDADNLTYALNDLIYVDILNPLTLYQRHDHITTLNSTGQNSNVVMWINRTQVHVNFNQLDDGFEVFNPVYQNHKNIEVAFKNPSSDSRQIQLFEEGETFEDYNAIFQPLSGGSENPVNSSNIGNNAYISIQDAQSFIGKETFILGRFKESCGTDLYFWIQVEFGSGGNSITLVNNTISAIPNTSLYAGEYLPCETYAANENGFIYLHISNVTIGDLQNPSNYGGGQVDYTNLIANLEVGTSHPLELIQTVPPADNPYQASWYVLIDWNDDGNFEESELVASYTAESVLNESLFIPNDAPTGLHAIRVILALNPLDDFCSPFAYGEVEDYTINIIDPDYVNPCPSNALNSYFLYIDEVTIGDLNSTTGNENTGYVDYNNLVANLSIGNNPLELIQGNPSSTTYTPNWYIFIDWNGDNIFEESELVSDYIDYQSVNDELFIPNTASLGLYKMRIIMSLHEVTNFCGDFAYGQVEDYTVNISASNCLADVEYHYTNNLPSQTHSSTYIEMLGVTVSDGDNVVIKAQNHIELLPSDQAGYITLIDEGANFEAFIEVCSSSAKQANSQEDLSNISSELKVVPNPFHNEFNITYELGHDSPVSIELYNIAGKQEAIISQEDWQVSGQHQILFDATDLVKGVYIIRIVTEDSQISQKLVKM